MRQSNNNKRSRENTAFLYVRLSRDDELDGESYSISNQKKLLTKVAKEKGYTHIVAFCDDGISGVTMNRPEFNKMIDQLELGKASAVFVKDLSRLGRNYIEVGRLIEDFFPEHKIRLVAVSDNVDTEEGENELAPIKNLFNEWYSRDISKKRRISNQIKGSSGIPLGPAPYGYEKSPEDPHKWVIDPEAALVVRRIFAMAMDGKGNDQIATVLTQEKVLTPIEYARAKGIRKASSKTNPDPYFWSKSTICKILSLQEYCGDVINFKTYSRSYKNKKRRKNSPENMMIFKDVHKPIIDRSEFERVQQIRKTSRKKPRKSGEHSLFSGLLRCADCGRVLHYHFNQGNHEIKYFNCPGYNQGKRKVCSSTHYIREDFLYEIIISEIRRVIKFALKHEDEFLATVVKDLEGNLRLKQDGLQSELRRLCERDKTLDRIMESLYEDNLNGKLSDERFKKMLNSYENEQKDLVEKIERLRNNLEEFENKTVTADDFMKVLKKIAQVKKLTAYMLNELIDHIDVHNAEINNGIRTQKLVIHYNCVGVLEIPPDAPTAPPEVSKQTRDGVTINYQPAI